jgi:hypothetical protein
MLNENKKKGGGASIAHAGKINESSFRKYIKYYITRYNNHRTAGNNHKKAHELALQEVQSGTPGSKGSQGRNRYSRMTKKNPLHVVKNSISANIFRKIDRDTRLSAIAFINHYGKDEKTRFVKAEETGADVHGKTQINGRRIGNSDIVVHLANGSELGSSNKYSLAGRDDKIKYYNPGGNAFTKILDDIGEKHLGKKRQLNQMFLDSSQGTTEQRNQHALENSEKLESIFKEVTHNTHGEKINFNSETGKMNKAAESYLRSIARDDDGVLSQHRKHQRWAAEFNAARRGSNKQSTTEVMAKMHQHYENILSSGNNKAIQELLSKTFNVEDSKDVIDTRLVSTYGSNDSGYPITSIYNPRTALKNFMKTNQGEISVAHTPGTMVIRILDKNKKTIASISHDRGTFNIQPTKEYFAYGHEASYGEEKEEHTRFPVILNGKTPKQRSVSSKEEKTTKSPRPLSVAGQLNYRRVTL